jgi:capsid protein
VDPFKNGKASELELKMGTISRFGMCAERGEDGGDVAVQLEEEEKRMARIQPVGKDAECGEKSDRGTGSEADAETE